MELLYTYDTLSSVEIKDQLELSWNEFTNNTKALQAKGYVRIQTGIVDDKVQQVIILEEFGRTEFAKLIELLKQFIERTKSFQSYLSSFSLDNLYPEN